MRKKVRKLFKNYFGQGEPQAKDIDWWNQYWTPTGVAPNPSTKGPMGSSPYTSKSDEANFKSRFEWLYDPVRGVPWDFNPVETRTLAQSDAWVQMLINNITSEIANTPWQIVENDNPEVAKQYNPYERVAKDKVGTKATDEDAERARELIENPNPDDDTSDLLEKILADAFEVGSLAIPLAFAKSDYNGQELVSDNPTLIHLKPSDPITFTKDFREKTGITDGYFQYDRNRNVSSSRFGAEGSGPIHFKTDELVWSDIHPRSNRAYGLPPTLAVKQFLQLLDLTIEQEQNYWSRGGFPAGFLKHSGDIDEIEALKEEGESTKGKPGEKILMIDDPEASYEKFSFNWKEMEMTEREQWYAKVIASQFQVPTSVVGLEPENVNRATFEGERGNFESNALGPKMQWAERILNSQVIWKHISKDIRFEFKPGMSETQRKQISDRVISEFKSNLVSRAEAREQLGYGEVQDEEDFHDNLVDSPEADELLSQMFDKKKEALRETSNWNLFELQPSDVEEFHEEIRQEVGQAFTEVVNDDDLEELVERFVSEQKNTAELTRKIREILEEKDITESLREKIVEFTRDKAVDSIDSIVEETGLETDADPIVARIENRELGFVDSFSDRFEKEVRDTISDGWQNGDSISTIRDNLLDKTSEFEEYQAERIARDQLQRATGEARNEFAVQHEDKFVERWITAGDDRVRPAHQEMHGKWKRPSESFDVRYERASGSVKEKYPGDSKHGIQCRCDTELVPKDEVGSSNHAGV